MTKTFHMGDNGPTLCEATKQACPKGGPHGGEAEIQALYNEKMNEQFGLTATVQRRLRASSQRMALKDMDATLLSSELRQNFPDRKMAAAIDIAAFAHRTQRRSLAGKLASTAYVDHPLRVALRLSRYGVTDEDTILAAVMHDSVEDAREDIATLTGRPLNDAVEMQHSAALKVVEELFNEEVAHIVDGVSNSPVKIEGAREEKNKIYFDKVSAAVRKDPRALLVKFSDWVDNAVGLYHAFDSHVPLTSSQVKGIQYRSVKYGMITPVYHELLPTIRHLVSEDGYRQMEEHISMAYIKLPELAKREK